MGQMGLKKKTGLGMATLIIAANIPDIDAVATLLSGVQHLAIRRGITHGPLAILILPILLTGLMVLFDRWQGLRGKRPPARLPIHKGWLLALAYIGALSHPALDWLNSYGVRLLEPFSSKWYYGDTIFIIDIWLWEGLISSIWISRRREKKGAANWQRPAWIGFAAVCTYIFANGLITGQANSTAFARGAKTAKQTGSGDAPDKIAVNPQPVTFWRRELLWSLGDGSVYRSNYSLFDTSNEPEVIKIGAMNNLLPIAKMRENDKNLDAFLFWSRIPVIRETGKAPNRYAIFNDARFIDPVVVDRFSVKVPFPQDEE